MSGLKYYVIDTETTGLRANYHEVNEIGIIRCQDRMQLWRPVICEYPERANFDSLKITKKTMADLSKGFVKNKVIEECNKFFEEDGGTPAHRCIVAHNASFDRRFLHAMWGNCNLSFPANLWLDTISLVKDYGKKNGMTKISAKLHDACDLLGIKKFADSHNAKVDSRNTYLIWRELIENRKVDFLPFIKTHFHNINSTDEELDMSLIE